MQTAKYPQLSPPKSAATDKSRLRSDTSQPLSGRTNDRLRSLSDDELMTRCRANDHRAFDALIGRYDHYIYSLAMRLSGNQDDANDLVSETTIRMFRYMGDFHHAVTLPAWIKRIVTNAYFDTRRRAIRRPSVSLDVLMEKTGDTFLADNRGGEYSPQLSAESNECKRILEDAIRSLPEAHRRMVSLFHAEEQSYAEIAARMKVPIGTVKSRLNRARATLRQILEPQMTALVS